MIILDSNAEDTLRHELFRLMERREITLRTVAELCGISHTTIHRFRSGKTVSLAVAGKLADWIRSNGSGQ